MTLVPQNDIHQVLMDKTKLSKIPVNVEKQANLGMKCRDTQKKKYFEYEKTTTIFDVYT